MKKWILVSFIAIVYSTACIPLKQYQETADRANQLDQEAGILRSENEELKVSKNELSAEVQRLKKQIEQLLQDTTNLSRRLQKEQYKYADLNKSYTDALQKFKNSSGSDADNKELLAFLQKLQEELQAREDALHKAETDLLKQQKELAASKSQMESQNSRLQELEKALQQKDNALLALRKSINDALTGFSSDELKVHMKDGKVYVSLEEKLLFQSGSYQVNTQGAEALRKIARVLEENKNIEIIVEGHTDKVPFKSGVLLDNWDLSVKRATSVVRIMLDNSQIDPSMISASGRSAFLPVKDGSDAASLQANRRTEIILTPKMDQILNLLENK
ncbi:OmpA family protein [Carboxylicivirga caseinilyticus]|uniref:OmpA family protein n=1 Tax=Carboxylicivirga caseinilyticus TaxID=3417572 RepID=UPI003D34871E|nr:OmpA family protein [Marinilabiliaceae bacterium A049]